MKSKFVLTMAISAISFVSAQATRIMGPFVPGTGNQTVVGQGDWEVIDSWGGNGANPVWKGQATNTFPDGNWLPHQNNNSRVFHYYSVATAAGTFGAWQQSGHNNGMVAGETYVISMFINMNGRPKGGPAEHHTFSTIAFNGGTSFSTPEPYYGVEGWQFIYTIFTADASNASPSLYLASNPVNLSVLDKVYFDNMAVTPIAQFQPPRTYRQPATYSVPQGTPFGGDVLSLKASDDNKFYILNDESDPNGMVEVTTELAPTGSSFLLKVESAASRTDISEFVEAFNYATNSYQVVATRTTTLADTVITATLGPSFIQADGQMKARIRYVPQQDLETSDGWLEAIDAITWEQL